MITSQTNTSSDSVSGIFGKTVVPKSRKALDLKNKSSLFVSDAYQTQELFSNNKPKRRHSLKNKSSVSEGLCWKIEDYKPGKRVGSIYNE